jgi:hypothetical protein
MKKNFIFKKKSLYILSGLILVAVLFSCIYIDSYSVVQTLNDGTKVNWVNAGEVATFKLNGHIECAADHSNEHFIVAMLAPKSWDIRNNVTMTYTTTVIANKDEVFTMSPIADTTSPKSQPGLTWSQALMNKYGVGTNVLNDMEWVAFQTDKIWDIHNGEHPYYEITIKCKTGMQNLKAHLGFFVNNSDNGLNDDNAYYKAVFSTECFEVVNGTGAVIDYCYLHSNKVEPLASLQNDLVTFSFVGNVYANELAKADAIYFEATAKTDAGNSYTVNEKTSKTLMKKQGTYGSTYSLTLWPEKFFGIPEGETITDINYIFTNSDNSITITQTDDNASGGSISGTKEPFTFKLMCQ